MGIEIDLNGLDISGNAEVMNDVTIRDSNDVHISLKNSIINADAKVLNNLDIDPILEELMQQAQTMDRNSAEYPKINKILGVKQWNKADFGRCVLNHLREFSQGVLASVVANSLTK